MATASKRMVETEEPSMEVEAGVSMREVLRNAHSLEAPLFEDWEGVSIVCSPTSDAASGVRMPASEVLGETLTIAPPSLMVDPGGVYMTSPLELLPMLAGGVRMTPPSLTVLAVSLADGVAMNP